MRILFAQLALVAFSAAHAQSPDPLKSAECAAALAGLQAARSGAGAPGRLEQMRGAAAAACLGSSTVPRRPSRVARPPVVVPPPQVEVPAQAAPAPAPALPPPPVAIERAPAPALCDANGCWTGDGTHLRHVPPNLAGPGGLCTQQGGVVYCP
jgi:hypothetical protein